MKEKIAYLKRMPLRYWSFVAAITADIIYILNFIWCIRKYTKLDISNPDEQREKENGLTEYISAHHAGQILFIIGVIILILAVTILFIAYIKETETFPRIVMTICLVCIDGVAGLIFLEDFLIEHEMYPDFFSIFTQLFGNVLFIGLAGSLLISFIIFVTDEDYRWIVLTLAASTIWFALGGYIIALGIGLIVFIIIGAIFDSSDDGGNILIEYDRDGKILNRWRKD